MLQQSTLAFLQKLKENNEKSWFYQHKDQYLEAKKDFESLISGILIELGKLDTDFRALQVKDCVFRIYKDVRFSKDKSPYKTHFAAGINRGGKKVHAPGYYFHLEPNGLTFCGGGIWRPSGTELKKIRQEIDYNFDEFKTIIQNKKFIKLFGSLKDEGALIRPPQGYTIENPAIYYLKMRNFVVGTNIEDDKLTGRNLQKNILDIFSIQKPLIDFLSRGLTAS